MLIAYGVLESHNRKNNNTLAQLNRNFKEKELKFSNIFHSFRSNQQVIDRNFRHLISLI